VIGYLTANHPLIQAFAPARRTRREAGITQRLRRAAPRLADLLPEGEMLAAKGPTDRPISGLVTDSRRVVPGAVFFALPGRRTDGALFIDEAVSRGAVAVVAARLPALPPARVTFIQVADVRAALAAVAQRYYGFPDRSMTVVGVTGTHGKTSIAHLLKHLLNGVQKVGLLGSVHYELGSRTVPAQRTTPESLEVYGLLAQMRDAGCRHAVLEVSSHGIEQQRVQGVQWGAAVLANLGGEHADYHGGAAAYAALKRRLFEGGTGRVPPVAVVNADDAAGRRLAADLTTTVPSTRVITYGENPEAHVRAERIRLERDRTLFRLCWPGGAMEIESPLTGRTHVSNLLAAAATAWGLGRDLRVVLARLRAFPGVPGRLERIDAGQAFAVWVDSAQTEETMRRMLAAVREVTAGRVLVVFGCGGHRDRAQRPLVTAAVQELADFALGTADSPRSEPQAQIFADMRAGVTAPQRLLWIEGRRQAIACALELARPGDSVVIAGRGHESYQEFADTVAPCDDRQLARELLRARAHHQEG
jgi:UDP-N-acetylmuramoyl-L-alanyl-D-glutamate--2,6-diaminopimelate ligase